MVVPLLLAGAPLPWVQDPEKLDPAAWGSDHVGLPLIEYTTGDQCLFCHRRELASSWASNRHNLTIRPGESDPASVAALAEVAPRKLVDQVGYVLGGARSRRFLKAAATYGHFELLSVQWKPPLGDSPGMFTSRDNPSWDRELFRDGCAGCHATGVDASTGAASASSLDCFVCHGEIPRGHTEQPALALLSPRRGRDRRVEISICSQCHVRSGRSRATGRPYPTHFVAGDNLFRDFAVDFSDASFARLSPADLHVQSNVRDLVLLGDHSRTCLDCHDIHAGSSEKHRELPRSRYCGVCHQPDGFQTKPFSSHSATCGY